MKCSVERIKKNIEEISQFNKTKGQGITRFSYSEEEKALREYLLRLFDELGLETRTDSVGNIRSRLIGKNEDLPIVMTGSHIDSVHHGGKFDGIAGVVAGIELMRVFRENNFVPNNSIELILFAEEEGSNFSSTMLGSKCITGYVGVDYLKKLINNKGESSYDVMKKFGLNPDNLKNDILKPNDIKAMIELHIEQSIVLDKEEKSIGIVTHIAGMTTLKIKILGETNHAGSTPMNMRRDALLEASKLIVKINEIVNSENFNTAVATVGNIQVKPNVSNIIAGEVEILVDIRDITNKSIDNIVEKIHHHIKENKLLQDNYTCEIQTISKSDSIELSKEIISKIQEYADRENINYKLMPSGAVHDAALISTVTDVGMIFVPSINGKSHCDDEYTKYEDIKIGCDALIDVVYNLSK